MFALRADARALVIPVRSVDIEGFKHRREMGDTMSKATKLVLGTVGVSAVLSIMIIGFIAFG